MGCEQDLRERVVEREDAQERDHDRQVYGAADPRGAAGGVHALVTADDRDDRAEQGRLDDRSPQVGRLGVVGEGREERAKRRVVDERRQHAAEDPEQQRVDVEQTGHEHQRQEPRHHEVLDGIDAHHDQGVELVADLAGAEIGGDRGARHARDHDRVDERRELPDRGKDEEAAEPVQRAEQH